MLGVQPGVLDDLLREELPEFSELLRRVGHDGDHQQHQEHSDERGDHDSDVHGAYPDRGSQAPD